MFGMPRCTGYTGQLHSGLTVCTGSNPAPGVVEVCDGKNL